MPDQKQTRYISPNEQKYIHDQNECLAVVEKEWLLWPGKDLALQQVRATELAIRRIIGMAPDQALEKVTMKNGGVVLFWCVAPDQQQRAELAELPGVR